MNKCQLRNRYLYSTVKYIFLTVHITIFLLCLFSFRVSYKYKLNISNYNLGLFCIGVLSLLLFLFIIHKLEYKKKYLILASLILFLFQIILAYHYYFYTGWDAQELITNASFLSNKNLNELNNNYFSRYPNNIFLTVLFSKVFEIFKGSFGADLSYFILIVIQSFINIVSGFFIGEITFNITKNSTIALTSYFLYLVLLYLSPWVTIPYSDSFGLVIPITIYYCYINTRMHSNLKIVCITLISILGYYIKPQTIIMVIAIILVSLLFDKINIKLLIKTIILIISVGMPLYIGIKYVNNNAGFGLNPEAEITYHHFIKMGLNSITDGGYLAADYFDSTQFDKKEDRINHDWNEVKRRINEYGLVGLAKHQIKKTLNNYNDGTFAWGLEGTFYREIIPNETLIAKIIRSLYYQDGKMHVFFDIFTQSFWILVLGLLLGMFIVDTSSIHLEVLVLIFSLIGLFLFESIFESRARYLYTYIPIFIVMASIGLNQIIKKSEKFIRFLGLKMIGEKNEQK